MPSPGSSSTTPAPATVVIPVGPGPAGTRARRLAASAASLVLLGALAACGSDETDASGSPDATPSSSPSSAPGTEASEPTPSSDPTDADDSDEGDEGTGGDGAGTPTGALADALLDASRLPGLNPDSPWSASATGPVGTTPFGWCATFDASVLGAADGVERQFTAGDGDQAGQQVLDLVDETNGRRAEQVLRGWHRDCQGRDGAQVGEIQSVPVSAGEAWWYLSSRPTGDGEWESYGVVRQGARLSLLRMQHTGQDHSYEAGQDPMELALAAAADQLG